MKNTVTNITGSDSIKIMTNVWLTPPTYAPIPLALLPEIDKTSAIDKAATAITIVMKRAANKDFKMLRFGMWDSSIIRECNKSSLPPKAKEV
jgi:hypothetical protein